MDPGWRAESSASVRRFAGHRWEEREGGCFVYATWKTRAHIVKVLIGTDLGHHTLPSPPEDVG